MKRETTGKLIKRIPGWCLDIKFTKLGFENECWIARQASRCQQAFWKPCLVNLIWKGTRLVFSISLQASPCQQAFWKPCLVNLIWKGTHLVFSIFIPSKSALTLCMLFFFCGPFFFKITFLKKSFSNTIWVFKQFGSRSGPTFDWAWSTFKLFAKIISRWRKQVVTHCLGNDQEHALHQKSFSIDKKIEW